MDEMNNPKDEAQNINPQDEVHEKASDTAESTTTSVSQEQHASHKSHFGKKALIFGIIGCMFQNVEELEATE